MSEKIIQRISREAGVDDLVDVLAERLSPSDLQSLLIEVYRRRSEALTPSDLLRQYQRDRFVQPAEASPIAQAEFDRLAYALLPPGFEAIELSPVAPLGSCAVVSPISQNLTLPTIRGTEVCADPTNMLALMGAQRRRTLQRDEPRTTKRVKLGASHRVLRTQRAEGPGSFQHFRLFVLCTAGRDEGSFTFETETLVDQIDFYLRLLDGVSQLGYDVEDVRTLVTALDERRQEDLKSRVLDPLSEKHPQVSFAFNPGRQSGRGYYTDVCFWIRARDRSGVDYLLIDGGFTTWTQQLLSNRKERLLTSGMGSERFCACF